MNDEMTLNELRSYIYSHFFCLEEKYNYLIYIDSIVLLRETVQTSIAYCLNKIMPSLLKVLPTSRPDEATGKRVPSLNLVLYQQRQS